MRDAKEMLERPWSFWVELPHAEGPSLAWQDSTDQHYLDYVDEIGVLFEKAPDTTLKRQHFVR